MAQDKYIAILSILNTEDSNESKAKLISKFIDDTIIDSFLKLLSEYQKDCK